MKNKNVWISIIAIAVIIIAGSMVFSKKNDTITTVDTNATTTSTQSTSTKPTTPTKPAQTTTNNSQTTSSTKKLSYSEAITAYEGRRIQFDVNCQTTPKGTVTFKNGTDIMLDNRAGVTRNFIIGSQTYNVGAFDFKIVKLQSSTLPINYGVDCGETAKNVINIYLQR